MSIPHHKHNNYNLYNYLADINLYMAIHILSHYKYLICNTIFADTKYHLICNIMS